MEKLTFSRPNKRNQAKFISALVLRQKSLAQNNHLLKFACYGRYVFSAAGLLLKKLATLSVAGRPASVSPVRCISVVSFLVLSFGIGVKNRYGAFFVVCH